LLPVVYRARSRMPFLALVLFFHWFAKRSSFQSDKHGIDDEVFRARQPAEVPSVCGKDHNEEFLLELMAEHRQQDGKGGVVERIERTPPTLGPGVQARARFGELGYAASRPVVRFGQALLSLSYRQKRVIMVAADGVMLLVAFWGALAVQSGRGEAVDPGDWMWLIAAVSVITIPIFTCMGLYRMVIHYLGEQAILAVAQAVFLSAVVLATLILIADVRNVPITATFSYCLIAFLLIGGSRLAMRFYFRAVAGTASAAGTARKRVAVYGAGVSGVQLVKALAFSGECRPVAFIDDDEALQRRVVNGLAVYAPGRLRMLIPKLKISQVLLAIPSVSPARRAEILASLDSLPVSVKTVPSLSDLVSGAAHFHDIREVDIEDMVGHKSVPQDETLPDASLRDRVVMVTGAGGSIGSQLCRRILRLGAKELILYEQSEFHLYQIEMELLVAARREGLSVDLVPLLGSVQDHTRLEEVLKHFKVDTVYHAAAYKHVPLVEQNVVEGARNNVLGSWHVATAAAAAGVQTCVLVSTDKAVRPTGVMGASKRLSELIFQGMAAEGTGPRFCIVRLGNVVGSSGSVIPLFREQLRGGGPLTVTDPRATRYFMSVSEAAELIIQAGAMGNGGEIFVLDMGQPVRIDDIARRMIRLAGFTVRSPDNPDGDIAIEYTGLRPGEKLHEELLIGNNVERTAVPKIMCAKEDHTSLEQIGSLLRLVNELCAQNDCEALRRVFLRTVEGYAPSERLVDRLWLRQTESWLQTALRRPDDLSNGEPNKDRPSGQEPSDDAWTADAVAPTKARRQSDLDPIEPSGATDGKREGASMAASPLPQASRA
jgi:FlaA1/EpsC-like NDP-sugar epimerase